MATIPTPEPDDLPEWGSSGAAGDFVDPGATLRSSGWLFAAGPVGTKPARTHMNWLKQKSYQWLAYVKDAWRHLHQVPFIPPGQTPTLDVTLAGNVASLDQGAAGVFVNGGMQKWPSGVITKDVTADLPGPGVYRPMEFGVYGTLPGVLQCRLGTDAATVDLANRPAADPNWLGLRLLFVADTDAGALEAISGIRNVDLRRYSPIEITEENFRSGQLDGSYIVNLPGENINDASINALDKLTPNTVWGSCVRESNLGVRELGVPWKGVRLLSTATSTGASSVTFFFEVQHIDGTAPAVDGGGAFDDGPFRFEVRVYRWNTNKWVEIEDVGVQNANVAIGATTGEYQIVKLGTGGGAIHSPFLLEVANEGSLSFSLQIQPAEPAFDCRVVVRPLHACGESTVVDAVTPAT